MSNSGRHGTPTVYPRCRQPPHHAPFVHVSPFLWHMASSVVFAIIIIIIMRLFKRCIYPLHTSLNAPLANPNFPRSSSPHCALSALPTPGWRARGGDPFNKLAKYVKGNLCGKSQSNAIVNHVRATRCVRLN